MYDAGVAMPAIRSAIETKYRPLFPTMTPTPPIRGK